MAIHEINITDFLSTYRGREITYIPNPGNGGDSIIAFATLQCFDALKLKYTIGNIRQTYKNKLLFYAGGGNLIGTYKHCEQFFLRNKIHNELILLPHTVKDCDQLLQSVKENVTIFAREKVSYDYVSRVINPKANIFLAKDMAFHIEHVDSFQNPHAQGTANCFRKDIERTNISIPANNVDLPHELQTMFRKNTSDIQVITQVTSMFFHFLSKYETINTNRLHVAIAASLLNKTVNLFPNSYYKNKAVYDYSIKEHFHKTRFYDTLFSDV